MFARYRKNTERAAQPVRASAGDATRQAPKPKAPAKPSRRPQARRRNAGGRRRTNSASSG